MFFTFYSFRGGQGQSLALTNAAVHLSMRGLRVLCVDMAFQAPSLPRLLGLQEGRERGLIDRIEEHLQGVDLDTPLADLLQAVPKSRDVPGEIYVLPAGGRRGGATRRAPDVPWEALYRAHEGYLFFENLRGEILSTLQPDLVLIDAGSGPADPAGIAVLQLADALVLVSGPAADALDALTQGTEHMPAEGPAARGPRERLVLLSPLPAGSEEAVERLLKAAARAGGTPLAIQVPYSPAQAWAADGRLVANRPGEPVSQAYRRLSQWLDGSGLDAHGFRLRIESQANRPANVIRLLQRVNAPRAAVLEAFREALVQEGDLKAGGDPLARHVADAQVPFRWRVAAAEALLELEAQQDGAAPRAAPEHEALAFHRVRYLPRCRLTREAEARALLALSGRVTGQLGSGVLLGAVQSLMHRGGDVPVDAILAVLHRVIDEGAASLSAQAVRLATRLPRRTHDVVVAWLEQLKYDEGMDIEALIDAVIAVGQTSPARAARCLVRLWTGSVTRGFPHRPALAALRELLEQAPGDVAPLLIEEGARLLARDFEHGWKEAGGRSALWYVLAPAHQGSALIGLVEDALSHWLVMGDRRGAALVESLLPNRKSVCRWVMLGALPLAPDRLRRRLILFVQEGFAFPPPGVERRWDATGVLWSDGQGPNAPTADPAARALVEDMARSGLRPPALTRAQGMLNNLEAHPELHRGLVLAVIHHTLGCEEQLTIAVTRSAEDLIFASLPQVVAVEAMIDLIRHRGQTRALVAALHQIIAEREAGAEAVADGLTTLAETQAELAVDLAERFLEVGPTPESWAGLLRFVEGQLGRRLQLLDRVLAALVTSEVFVGGALSPLTVDALEGALLATVVGGKRGAIREARRILTSPHLPQWARRRICRALAGRLGVGLEGRRAERLLGKLIEHDAPAVRGAAAQAVVQGALDSSPETSLTDEMLLRLAAEVDREHPALDVIHALLFYLSEWSSDLPGSAVGWVAKVHIPTSPAVAEPQLVTLALEVLARILRAGRVDTRFLDAARELRDALREGGVEPEE